MPRTKLRKQNTTKLPTQFDEALIDINKAIEACYNQILDYINEYKLCHMEQVEAKYLAKRAQIVQKYTNMLIVNLQNQNLFSSSSTYLSADDISNVTQSKTTKKPLTRSSSCTGDDEGYLTTESSNSGPRASRSRARKTVQKSRVTRSLSRNNQLGLPSKARDQTPLNRGPVPDTFGLVTPKVKPNTPMVLLRRPKTGEVAISMQGSPLLIAPPMPDETANINIPLVDGTVLTLQAQNGLRRSQIPDLDPTVKRQLEKLRANLDMMI